MAYAWSELPNSHHIDWVLETLKQNPQLWGAAAEAAEAAWYTAWYTAWSTAWSRNVMRDAEWDVKWAMAAPFGTAAKSAVVALVAYDDCDQYLNMGYEKLHVYAILSEKPQAVLLLPMVYVREKLNERMVTLT